MLKTLKSILEEEGLMNKGHDLESRYTEAVRSDRIRELLEIETPQITNFTDLLQIENSGRLYAIRMDLYKGVNNHKKPVVAGLILRRVLDGKIPKERIDTLIDGGNYNSADALKYYTERIGMKGIYIMSRFFEQKPEILDELSSPNFKVAVAPMIKGKPIEREFYEYLFYLMKYRQFNRNKACLWHAKHGGKAMYPFGREIATSLEETPDFVVSCIGAGSTLEGLQIAIQDHFLGLNNQKPSIIIGEHELSPLFTRFISYRPSFGSPRSVEETKRNINPDFYDKVDGLPHLIIGPHYDEINPLIPKEAMDKIDEVIQYSDTDCIAMQKYLKENGISVGNSSAANLNVAANLANEGNKVVTVIFEPFREFYKKKISSKSK